MLPNINSCKKSQEHTCLLPENCEGEDDHLNFIKSFRLEGIAERAVFLWANR
jgi:hypothetical protein